LKISVSLSLNIFEALTYRIAAEPPAVSIGSRVLVPLGQRIASGWVVGLDSGYRGRLKDAFGVIDDPFRPDARFMEFVLQGAAAYFSSAGGLLDHALPASKKNLKKLCLDLEGRPARLGDLPFAQLEKMAARQALRFYFAGKAAALTGPGAGPASAPLLPDRLFIDPERAGEYRSICREVIAAGRSVLLVVPDSASARYWQTVWPDLDVFNSETRAAAREAIWSQYQLGKSGLVCGGLAAVLLPMPNLGLLIIDRASSPLYQRTFRAPFKIDHLARIRARAGAVPLWQGAAAHTCSSYHQRDSLAVSDRRQPPGPSCHVHALAARDRGIPEAIVELIKQNFLQGRKTLVLVNKMEPAHNLFCAQCKKIAPCPGCGGVLFVDERRQAACRRCSFRQDDLSHCPRCHAALTLLHDISVTSLARAIARTVSETQVQTLNAADLRDVERAVAAVRSRGVVIATPAALNPFFKGIFSSVIYIKPESFFGMDEFNSAEMIYGTAAEIAETLLPGSELHVFSVFHFHYALQFLMDEEKFFARELKYRQWFMLPPFSDVYRLEIKNAELRKLAAVMRSLFSAHRDGLQIRKAYIVSRQPLRGAYSGVLELHAPAARIIAAGLARLKKSSLSLLAG
jgi:primosomal protein N'